MPTPSEQKALSFVAIVILLAGAVRVVRAGSGEVPPPLEQQGLARQAQAVDSAARARAQKKAPKAKPLRIRDTVTRVWGGFPPPSPRIDTDAGVQRSAASHAAKGSAPVDLDAATQAEIETLPRIGPALARRIVANRDSLGPFRTLEAVGRVKGMGPATLRVIAGHVHFSGRAPPARQPR